MLGLRLERRLRGLRQSHADFAKAVGELDQAAYRTESSLDALRTGAEDIKGELASRIDQARIACQRLEKLSTDAERLANQPLVLSQALAPPPPGPGPPHRRAARALAPGPGSAGRLGLRPARARNDAPPPPRSRCARPRRRPRPGRAPR